MENICIKLLKEGCVDDALELLRLYRWSGSFHTGVLLGGFLTKHFPFSQELKEELALCLFHSSNFEEAYDMYTNILDTFLLNEEDSKRMLFNQHFCIDKIKERYTMYPLQEIQSVRPNHNGLVTFSITSCKRYSLFEKTMNSFLQCCLDKDLISRWICVDDNSSTEDRHQMRTRYPFFEFIFKDKSQKGHPQSMNIIRETVKSPYLFHLEDDFCFLQKRRYITECINVLNENKQYGQCLINKNYTEKSDDIDINGGLFMSAAHTNLRYYIHEWCKTKEEEDKWRAKYGNNSHGSFYWPHFSFRPSLIRTCVLADIGSFSETAPHFEMEYAHRYAEKGYISCFLEGIYCLHTGRLTCEKHDPTKLNAYILNGEAQFSKKDTKPKETSSNIESSSHTINNNTNANLETVDKDVSKDTEQSHTLDFSSIANNKDIIPQPKPRDVYISIFVINLDRRPDRYEKFVKNIQQYGLSINRYSAVDGTKLKPNRQLQKIFENNDYNMRRGMVGCAMSHIDLYINCLEDTDTSEDKLYMIFEDDIEFYPNFNQNLTHLIRILSNKQWDMLYLGHHLRDEYKYKEEPNSSVLSYDIEQWDIYNSIKYSLGGTGGYIIKKSGMRKILDHIEKTGMTNGIDTIQQKCANEMTILYVHPHLFKSECFRGNNKPDTDIQFNYDSLTVNINTRLLWEKLLIEQLGCKICSIRKHRELFECIEIWNDPNVIIHFKASTEDEIGNILSKIQNYKYYLIGPNDLFIVHTENIHKNKLVNRLKIDSDKYSVKEALIYN